MLITKVIKNKFFIRKKLKAYLIYGYTITEMAVVIAIIGTIAALTIPPLVGKYKEEVWSNAAKVFESKLNAAISTMNVQQTLAGYQSTEEFVNVLSKHLKITRICKNDNLAPCFEDEVYWIDNEKIDMSEIKTARQFGYKMWNTNVMGLQFANGVTGVIAYNPECKQNAYSNEVKAENCLALLYDTDGYKMPNEKGKDLRSINVPKLGKGNCSIDLLNGTCFTAPLSYDAVSRSECNQLKENGYPINNCPLIIKDYWAGAVKTCKDAKSRLPNASELQQLANLLYGEPVNDSVDVALDLDEEKASSMGFELSLNSFSLWAAEEAGGSMAYYRYFNSNNTGYSTYSRAISGRQVICVAD